MSVKLKTIIVGDAGVGKSSLILRIHPKKFPENITSTNGVDYKSTTKIFKGK